MCDTDNIENMRHIEKSVNSIIINVSNDKIESDFFIKMKKVGDIIMSYICYKKHLLILIKQYHIIRNKK